MLQKILVAFMSVVMMVVGAVTPAFDPSTSESGSDDVSDVQATVRERVVTRGYAANHDFAAVSVLSVKVDGQLVLEDAVGQGHIDALTFKVGVKKAEGNTLLIGDEDLTLTPTDEITIRGFRGKFQFRDMGTSHATLSLDGTVTRTLFSEGDPVKQVRTETAGRATDRLHLADGADAPNLPYVILEGRAVQTVSLDRGDARPLSTANSAGAGDGSAPIFAKWVKIDGKLVDRYTWGDGPVDRIEFEPTETARGTALLTWSEDALTLQGNRKVVVTDFLGTYRVTQADGGGVTLDLQGYAKNVSVLTRTLADAIPDFGNQPPVAKFGLTPVNATTGQTIEFTDLSNDPDGVVVYRKWDFGDGQSTVLQNPRHRYAKPGTYTVSLQVTDNNLATSFFNKTLTVGAAPPVSDWDFSPKRPTSLDPVQFMDKSWDPDGSIVSYEWDFGDGTTSPAANPAHQYLNDGNYTVTLTVTDVHGLTNRLTKILRVDNAPPEPSFSYTPAAPLSGNLVEFTDESSDADGNVTSWKWEFGDGGTDSRQHPTHTFSKSGTFTVKLTVADDDGASASYSTEVRVENRAPQADFTWNPPTVNTSDNVRFTDLSVDTDGDVVSWSWNFGDGTTSTQRNPTHQFRTNATYRVCLTVRDDHSQTAFVCKLLGVANSPPRADFAWPTSPIPLALQQVPFTDLTTDQDGDAIVSWHWDFGYGNATSFVENPTHVFPKTNNYPVTLTVTDAKGHVGSITKSVQILNNPPEVSLSMSPNYPRVGDQVRFEASASDLDGTLVSYEWKFGDGTGIQCDQNGCTPFGGATLEGNVTDGDVVYHTFSEAQIYGVSLTVTDDDGGTRTILRSLNIARAVADADFSWTPNPPTAGRPATFHGIAEGGDRPIVRWEWSFVGVQNNLSQDAIVVFPVARTYEVRLRIVDDLGDNDTETKFIYVNDPPTAAFQANTTTPKLHEPVKFTDLSSDPDGNVTSWYWEFGDGSTSVLRHPVHSYASTGKKVVKLTVTDDAGAKSSTTGLIWVDNIGPSAEFSYSPSAPTSLSPVSFTSLSTDPDPHDLIEVWEWRFGDGNESFQQHPNHTYGRSGFYIVQHRVSDGDVYSSFTGQLLRVTSPYDVCYTVKVKTPDGRFLEFNHPDLELEASLHRQHMTHLNFTKNDFRATVDNHGEFCLPGGTWVRGDSVAFQARLKSAVSPEVSRYLDREQPVGGVVVLNLPAALVPTVEVAPGEQTAEPISFWKGYNSTRYPVYHDQTEQVHGTGHVDWEDGAPASGVQVDVQVRYIGLRAFANAPFTPEHNPVNGWCSAAVVTTDASGDFTWKLGYGLPCLSPLQSGAMLPGWWQVRAVAAYNAPSGNPPAQTGTSDPVLFLEDPFGLLTGNVAANDGAPP